MAVGCAPVRRRWGKVPLRYEQSQHDICFFAPPAGVGWRFGVRSGLPEPAAFYVPHLIAGAGAIGRRARRPLMGCARKRWVVSF